jgi:hypothetical protein
VPFGSSDSGLFACCQWRSPLPLLIVVRAPIVYADPLARTRLGCTSRRLGYAPLFCCPDRSSKTRGVTIRLLR